MEDKDMMRLATEVLAADPEKLAAAIEKIIVTAGGYDTIYPAIEEKVQRLAQKFKMKRDRLDFGHFKLARFRADDSVELIGISPANDAKTSRDVYKIVGVKSNRHLVATVNGRELFTISGPGSFLRLEKCAVSALHRYLGENKRRHIVRRRAKLNTPEEGAES